MTPTKVLFLLDLDHTLIYGSYAEKEKAEFLFRYNKYLKVYKRDWAEELITLCKSKGTIIVYTTALRKYAKTICEKLNIEPLVLLSRKNCKLISGTQKKQINPDWLLQYDKIIIIDDSPNVWLIENESIHFMVPEEFRGLANDNGLIKVIQELKQI